jgi:hypothetical protein
VVKDWLLIVLSVVLFGSPVTATSLVGYLIAFAGVKCYNNQRVANLRAAADAKDSGAKADEATQPLLQREESCASPKAEASAAKVASE